MTLADIVRDQIVHSPVHALHRIDRGTSGIVLFALDSDTARCLQEQFQNGTVRKSYFALVRGVLHESCIVDHPIPKEYGETERVDAITEFEPVAGQGRWCLIEARPITGRSHQIRRHLKHISHPIVGDVRYGKGDVNRFFRETYGFHRLALHAEEITFQNQKAEHVVIKCPLPDEFVDLLNALEIGDTHN